MIGVELSKLLRRPRTWVTITLLAGLPVVVGIFLKATGIAPRPGSGPALLSEVLNNGVLFPAAALALILPVFLPVAVAVIAGDAIAGEASAGTLRYLLARPVSRSRLVTAKVVMALVVHRAGHRHRRHRRPHRRRRAVRHQAADLPVRDGADHAAGHPAHGPRRALHRLVDAGPGRDRPVRLDPDRLTARRRAERAGRLRDVAGPGPDRRHPVASSPTCRPTTGCRSSTSSATRSSGAASSAASCSKPSTSIVFLGAAWASFTTKDITS